MSWKPRVGDVQEMLHHFSRVRQSLEKHSGVNSGEASGDSLLLHQWGLALWTVLAAGF